MSTKVKKKPPQLGGGSLEIPVEAALPPAGRRYTAPPDREAVAEAVQERIAEAEENQSAIEKIAGWLIGLERVPRDEQVVWEAERVRQVGQLETAVQDQNPLTRKVAAFQVLRWILTRAFMAFGQISDDLAYLTKLGVLFVRELTNETDEVYPIRFNRMGYEPDPELGFSLEEIQTVRTWFSQALTGVKEFAFKEWEACISRMKQASTITLEELILGLDGLCYFVVPEGTMKNRVTGQDVHLEGGHLLVSVSQGRISLAMFAGDPDTGKGFAFVRVLSRVKALRPSAYIPVKALRYWTPIPKTHEGMVPAQAEAVERTLHFFRDHPENARAATLLHALLRRTIELAFNVDSLDYARLQQQGVRVAYLEKRGSPKTDAGAPASADQ